MSGGTAAAVAALTILATACTGAATRAVEDAQPSPDQRYQAARPVVIRYLTAIAHHRPLVAYVAPATASDRASLIRLQRWLGGIPAAGLQIDVTSLGRDDPGTAGMIATLAAPLGGRPSTATVSIGQLALLVRRGDDGGWRVAADISRPESRLLDRGGLAAVPAARFLVGSHSVVVDATGSGPNSFSARLAGRVADAAMPGLVRLFNGPRRALIFITSDWAQADRIVPGDYSTEPTGVTVDGLVMLNEAQWRYWGDPGAQGVVVHELTHLETEPELASAPTSLAGGSPSMSRTATCIGTTARFRWPTSPAPTTTATPPRCAGAPRRSSGDCDRRARWGWPTTMPRRSCAP
ncbi:MAG: hypothetical protein QOF08_1741 [Gaiellales bacterium]|nr:hypothetical protein [Gaiellales bacterium]